MSTNMPRANWIIDPKNQLISRAYCGGRKVILIRDQDESDQTYYQLIIKPSHASILNEDIKTADLTEAKLIAEDRAYHINTVKSLQWFMQAINEWTKLAEQIVHKEEATEGEITKAFERLVRAETLEAALDVNGPGQTVYERIETCKRNLRRKQADKHR